MNTGRGPSARRPVANGAKHRAGLGLDDGSAVPELTIACSSCGLRELCLPGGVSFTDMARLDGLVEARISVERGNYLYRRGDPFEALYGVRTGFFKTRTISNDEREHITGFQLAGELLGLDGLGTEVQTCDAIALEDSQVCRIAFAHFVDLASVIPRLQRHFHRIVGKEIVRDHRVMMVLGSMTAEERLAAFLVNLSQRLETRGFSSSSMLLRMTREEIGSYLGLKLETVSRGLSKFTQQGILSVRNKEIQILDPRALEQMVEAASI